MSQSDLPAGPQSVFTHYLNADPGKLAYQYCQNCAATIFYPRVLCPTCGGTALIQKWEENNETTGT